MRVTLIGTVHGESGAATTAALVALLERLNPQVVFAEIPKANADRYRDGSHGNLESLAVADYATRHPVIVMPVDDDAPEEAFFGKAEDLFDRVERASRDYRNLVDRHTDDTESGGLRYLNSPESMQAWLDIQNEVRASIDWIRAPELHRVFDSWIHVNECRDRVMLSNIAAFATTSELTAGVFLVGAAHRRSIVEKVRSGVGEDYARIDWQLELPPELFD